MTRAYVVLTLAGLGSCSTPAVATDAAVVDQATAEVDAAPPAIRYVVVIVKENHTFDNYFMNFPGAATSKTAKLHTGQVITRTRAPNTDLLGDLPHSNAAAIADYDLGKMDGFDLGVPSEPMRPFYFYDESQIPNYWKYARNFSLFDHFYSTTAGPTSPGHFAIMAGQSPFYDNQYCTDGSKTCGYGCITPSPLSKVPTLDLATCTVSASPTCLDIPTIVDVLPAGVTWRAYGTGTQPNINSPFTWIKKIGGDATVRAAHFRDLAHILPDIAGDDLANFTQIDIYSGPNKASEHPPTACSRSNAVSARVAPCLRAARAGSAARHRRTRRPRRSPRSYR